jgi:hypothetical protein
MHTQSDPAGFPLCFQSIPGVSASPTTWVNSNQTLGRFIQGQRLNAARKTASQIHNELTALFPLIDRVSRATCPCADACCLVTKVWFDFIDLLFFHLISVPLPPAPLADRLEDPCRYLSPKGCRLPRLIRPWGCLQYTCPIQRRYLCKHHPQDEARLDLTLEHIRTLRYRLEDEIKRAVTSPSVSAISPTNIQLT